MIKSIEIQSKKIHEKKYNQINCSLVKNEFNQVTGIINFSLFKLTCILDTRITVHSWMNSDFNAVGWYLGYLTSFMGTSFNFIISKAL